MTGLCEAGVPHICFQYVCQNTRTRMNEDGGHCQPRFGEYNIFVIHKLRNIPDTSATNVGVIVRANGLRHNALLKTHVDRISNGLRRPLFLCVCVCVRWTRRVLPDGFLFASAGLCRCRCACIREYIMSLALAWALACPWTTHTHIHTPENKHNETAWFNYIPNVINTLRARTRPRHNQR